MSFKLIPNDIPLPVPTGGLEIVDAVLTLLLVVAWLVHILFINVLLGAATGSVYFNRRGVRENNPVFDRVGYLLTTPVTISENMGALWGVAPLLLISVMFTPLFYAAAIMNSPQWLHIIYGNIAAFLLSYLYKFTWHTGKSWFLVPTVLNLFAGPLVLFHFPSYGIENFFNAGWHWLIVIGVVSILGAAYLTLKDFFDPKLSTGKLWSIIGLAMVTLLSMATLRHGMRLSLTSEAIAQSRAQSDDFVQRSQAAAEAAAKATPKVAATASISAGEEAANKYGCMACHSAEQKLVGPAYKDVAARGYAEREIIELIYAPKPENWPGFIPMPAQGQVRKDDAAAIAKWINSLK